MNAMFQDSFLNPFTTEDAPANLVNFASGVTGSQEVEESLLSALDRGHDLAKKFETERLVRNEGSPVKSFYHTMSRSGIKTMKDMIKTTKLATKQVSMNAEVMYLRLLAINASKKVPLMRVLSFENCPCHLACSKKMVL